MQIKLFCSTSMEKIEKEINDFLSKKPNFISIEDIKLEICPALPNENNVIIGMVMYKQIFKPLNCDKCGDLFKSVSELKGELLCETCFKGRLNYETAISNMQQ